MGRIVALVIVMVLLCGNGLFAGDKYIQYDLDKLYKKSEQRLKEIDKKLKVLDKKKPKEAELQSQAEKRKAERKVREEELARKKELERVERQAEEVRLKKIEEEKEFKRRLEAKELARAREQKQAEIKIKREEEARKRREQEKKWREEIQERARIRKVEVARKKEEKSKQKKIITTKKPVVLKPESNSAAQTSYNEGVKLYSNGQFNKARDAFEKAISLDPDNNRAETYLKFNIPNKLKQLELARHYKQERNIKENVAALMKKGKALYWKKDYNAAAVKFRKILSLDPENKEALGYMDRISQR